jgi:hypothetical protein
VAVGVVGVVVGPEAPADLAAGAAEGTGGVGVAGVPGGRGCLLIALQGATSRCRFIYRTPTERQEDAGLKAALCAGKPKQRFPTPANYQSLPSKPNATAKAESGTRPIPLRDRQPLDMATGSAD